METTTTVTRYVSGARLMAETVRDSEGHGIGKIEDYIIDSSSGRIEDAVLSFGGFLGFGGKLFAIPWRALHLDPEHYGFVLDVTEDQLRQAPSFDRNDWPDPNDADYSRRVAGYWGVGPEQPQAAEPGTVRGDTVRDREVMTTTGEPGTEQPYTPGEPWPHGSDYPPQQGRMPQGDYPPGRDYQPEGGFSPGGYGTGDEPAPEGPDTNVGPDRTRGF